MKLTMNERAFLKKSVKPTEENLQKILGHSYPFYKELTTLVQEFDSKWNFYKGWLQKFSDKKNAFFYFVPQNNSFKVSMPIRAIESEELMKNALLKFIPELLQNSEKSIEVYSVHLEVTNKESSDNCINFLKELIYIRKT